MYLAVLNIKVPKLCYFCQKRFLSIKDIAILEGHAFCPNCGYEIMDSNVEIDMETFSPEDHDNVYYSRARGFTA